jgi:hypothetical protein
MLDRNCIVFAGGKNLGIKAVVHAFHEVIAPFDNDSNQSLAFPLRECNIPGLEVIKLEATDVCIAFHA